MGYMDADLELRNLALFLSQEARGVLAGIWHSSVWALGSDSRDL